MKMERKGTERGGCEYSPKAASDVVWCGVVWCASPTYTLLSSSAGEPSPLEEPPRTHLQGTSLGRAVFPRGDNSRDSLSSVGPSCS